MAYAQKHMSKSPLKQIGGKIQAAKEHVAKKEKEGMDYKETKAAQRFANREKGTGTVSGTEINVKSKQVEAKPFEKKFVESKAGAPAMITDASGKPIKKAAYSSVNSKAIDALRKEYSKMKASTEESRTANAIAATGHAKRGGGFK
jgi:hypothetical protein